ncbi:MAG: family 43 glycosylhydrolase [Bacteriovoracia bacterium]
MQSQRPFPFLVGFFLLLVALTFDAGPASAFGGGRKRSNNGGGGGNPAPRYMACPGVGSVAVNGNYQNDANGAYCMVRNQHANGYNFMVEGQHRYLADPTIVKVADYYYVTGTTDELQNHNYWIYRSRDLVNWERHRRAFDPAIFQGQSYCNLWAPHLFTSPASPSQIFISFTATQSGTQNICARSDSYHFISVYGASMPIAQFTAGTGYFGAPQKYGYSWQGTARYDGGVAAGRPIPGSADMSNVGGAPGQTRIDQGLPCIIAGGDVGCAGTFALDSFVYVDPTTNQNQNRLRMLYTWHGLRQGLWAGNNIATHRMANELMMDTRTQSSSTLKDLAYQVNTWNKIDGRYLNGSFGNQGGCEGENCGGVAEGPAAFHRDGRHYLVFSRNPFDGPAYGLFYRMTSRGQSFDTLFLNHWRNETIREHVLAVSHDRETPRGVSFGHGDVFQGPTVAGGSVQFYVILHMKEENSYNRIPFFKELTFRSDGTIEPLSNDPNADYKHSLMWFRIPRPRG